MFLSKIKQFFRGIFPPTNRFVTEQNAQIFSQLNDIQLFLEQLSAENIHMRNMFNITLEEIADLNTTIQIISSNVGLVGSGVESANAKIEAVSSSSETANLKVEAVGKNLGEVSLKIENLASTFSGFGSAIGSIGTNTGQISSKVEDANSKIENISSKIEKLSSAFSDFGSAIGSIGTNTGQISSKVEDANSKIENISSKIEKLSSAFSDFGSAIGSIGTNTGQISSKVEDANSKIENISSKIEKLSSAFSDFGSAIGSIGTNTGQISSKVENVSSKIENMSSKVENANSKIENANEKIEQSSVKFEQYSYSSQKELAALRVQIPFDRVLYANIQEEKKTYIDLFQKDQNKFENYTEKFLNLIKNLEKEDVETVVRILKRVSETANAKENQTFLNLYSLKEQDEIRTMWDHFDKNIIKTSDDFYSCNGYFLPFNNFNPSVLYYSHGINELKNLEFLKDKDIIDAGAFIGDSAIVLSPLTNKKIYSFEAMEKNCDYMKKTIEYNNLNNIVIENSALFDYVGNLEMYLSDDIDANSIFNFENSDNLVSVPCTTIDDYVEKNNLEVGLIKTDVEGAEQGLLRGAINTIKKFKPTLILSIYHNADDFFNIKPMIENLNLGYTFKIYRPPMMNILTDTLLIAESSHH